MGEGAFKILPKIMNRAGIRMNDIDFFEINEAFAAVGSVISLGHPVGCTGVRQVLDMVHQLRKRGKTIGVTTRCVGGGMRSGEVIEVRT
ncbi:Thiolase [Trypanosoma melophagium]|uniref:Thiolase n=1 Tax=Trypanosoma melophagium TaxID=715481 RepID=UPI00351A3F71|nr:Thiolase [Trypanosoma melophagium]